MANGSDSWVVYEKLKILLKKWSSITYYTQKASPKYEQSALEFLGLRQNPFGSERAEHNRLVIDGFYSKLPILLKIEELSSQYPLFVSGLPGTGKTATIFQLIFTALNGVRGDLGFPVYFPTSVSPDIFEITKIVASTLLTYFAPHPYEFLRLQEQNRQQIVHLWVKFVDENESLLASLRMAGLPQKGPGADMLNEVQRLMRGLSSLPTLSKDECLHSIRGCIPSTKKSIQVFLDWQGEKPSYNMIKKLAEHMDALASSDIYLTAFFRVIPEKTSEFLNIDLDVQYVELTWQNNDLKGLLTTRLNQCGEDSIASWCDSVATTTRPDDRLINASRGTPAGLIRKGNQIFNLVGEMRRKLSEEDLNMLFETQN